MKKYCFGLFILLQSATAAHAQPVNEFSMATKQWFTAWELLSREVYGLKQFYSVDFVFFDSVSVYSTSSVTVGNGASVAGPAIMGQSYSWKQAAHHGSITLPDSNKIPVGLLSFAGDNKITNKPFFVMPLPSFWKTAGVTSAELGLDNLVTGVFLHEFSHSQQMQNFGKKIADFESSTNFGVDFTDDIVQDLLKKNPDYVWAHEAETNMLYTAAMEKESKVYRERSKQVLMTMSLTHQQFFKDSLKALTTIDDFFLTMEGLGQYSMYAWFIHPKGGNLPKDLVIKGVRRSKKQWSQDKGFALFLLLEKYVAPAKWAPAMFETETTAVTEILLNTVHQKK